MLQFLAMLTTLKATSTDYVNDWDGKLEWTAGPNQLVTGLYSVHDNWREDRRWKFYSEYTPHVTTIACVWSEYVNHWDGLLLFICPSGYAIVGFESVHNNRREDRRWKIRSCIVHGASLKRHLWSGLVNNFDGELDYKCNSGEVMTGLYSYHDSAREDRRWNILCAKLDVENEPDYRIESSLSGYRSTYDKRLSWDAGQNGMITGFQSYHRNEREDRRWKFYHGYTNLKCYQGTWSDYINKWDASFSFSCPFRSVLNGVFSDNDDYYQDRRWKFKCCKLPKNAVVVQRHFSGYMNDWDKDLDFVCHKSNEAIIAVSSYHDNYREDRRWKFQCGAILKL